MQNLIFFYSSTRTQLEDLHKFDQKKTLEQVFGQNDFTKLLGSCRRLRLGYLEKYFKRNVCFALVVYIIDSIIELESKFFLARHWDFIWWSSRSTYEQRPVSDVTKESLLAEPFPNPPPPPTPTPLKVNSWQCSLSKLKSAFCITRTKNLNVNAENIAALKQSLFICRTDGQTESGEYF